MKSFTLAGVKYNGEGGYIVDPLTDLWKHSLSCTKGIERVASKAQIEGGVGVHFGASFVLFDPISLSL